MNSFVGCHNDACILGETLDLFLHVARVMRASIVTSSFIDNNNNDEKKEMHRDHRK